MHAQLINFNIFFFNDPPTTEIYTLSLHDALPISGRDPDQHRRADLPPQPGPGGLQIPTADRSEEHTSELQSQSNLVCRLLLEKKKKKTKNSHKQMSIKSIIINTAFQKQYEHKYS